jgi:hypothetical protein
MIVCVSTVKQSHNFQTLPDDSPLKCLVALLEVQQQFQQRCILGCGTALNAVHGLIMYLLPGGFLTDSINSSDCMASNNRMISE